MVILKTANSLILTIALIWSGWTLRGTFDSQIKPVNSAMEAISHVLPK